MKLLERLIAEKINKNEILENSLNYKTYNVILKVYYLFAILNLRGCFSKNILM